MSQSSATPAGSTESSTQHDIPESRSGDSSSASATSQGRTTIAPSVVEKIAGVAGRDISGVYMVGGGVSRAFGAIRERIPGGGTATTSGVQVEVGEKQAAIDLDIVVEYGVSIMDLARAVRRNVIHGVERMTGLQVIEVNISVNDVHLPTDSDESEGREGATARVE